jgi:hypothetical protein
MLPPPRGKTCPISVQVRIQVMQFSAESASLTRNGNSLRALAGAHGATRCVNTDIRITKKIHTEGNEK